MSSPPKTRWTPTVAYSKSLADVRSQLTPAEKYRQEAAKLGKLKRRFIKYEQVWQQPEYLARIVRIQSAFRGWRHRRHFALQSLRVDLSHRQHVGEGLRLFEDGMHSAVVAFCATLHSYPSAVSREPRLLLAYATSQYKTNDAHGCVRTCTTLIASAEVCPGHPKASYLLACAHTRLQEYDQAFASLARLVNTSATELLLADEVYRLHALVCAKLRPHRLPLAVADYAYLLALNPMHMSLYLEQSYMLIALQEYELAASNLSFILTHEPSSITVLLLRAKVYGCQRKWKEAVREYEYVLSIDSFNEIARSELDILLMPENSTPMLDLDALKIEIVAKK